MLIFNGQEPPILAPGDPACQIRLPQAPFPPPTSTKSTDTDALVSRIGRRGWVMPLTQVDWPILQQFFCIVEKHTGLPPQPLEATPEQVARARRMEEKQQRQDDAPKPKQLPKGVVLGPDGKPCRSCTSFASWAAMTKQKTLQPTTISTATPATAATSLMGPPDDCPPDVEQLGRSGWTLLHSMTGAYPDNPTPTRQAETKQFIHLFSKYYPCWVCADDFQAWMKGGNEPKVSNREEFGRWMCEAHNAVNVKLGKEKFDCNRWEERWRTGWKDGRCD